jgi:hypothetical protein
MSRLNVMRGQRAQSARVDVVPKGRSDGSNADGWQVRSCGCTGSFRNGNSSDQAAAT